MAHQNVAGVLTGRGLMDCLQYYDNCLFNTTLTFINIFQWVGSIDLVPNEQADGNVIVKPSESWTEQHESITQNVETLLGENKVDAILCVAGGWAGGNAANKGMKYCNFRLSVLYLLMEGERWPNG
jgi:hypothetical protein